MERVKPNAPMRGIVIKDKAWVCSDGETWHAGTPDDRLLYNWAHTPIMTGRLEPAFENVGTEQRDGQTWLHIRLKVAEAKADPKELPQYWLVLDSQGQAQYIGHAEMPKSNLPAPTAWVAAIEPKPRAMSTSRPTSSQKPFPFAT